MIWQLGNMIEPVIQVGPHEEQLLRKRAVTAKVDQEGQYRNGMNFQTTGFG